MTILLADDERMVRLGLISMLDELYPGEHRYIEAKNGEEMVAAATARQPDVAFVDIRMPLLDGLDALGQARELSPHTAWIVLTGYAEFGYAQKALKLGAQNYLLKPVALEELRAAIEQSAKWVRQTALQKNKTFGFDMVQAYSLYQLCREVEPQAPGHYSVQVFFIDHWDISVERLRYRELYSQLEKLYRERELADAHTLFYLNTGELCVLTLELDTAEANRRMQALAGMQDASVTVVHADAGQVLAVMETLERLLELSVLRCVRGLGGVHSVKVLEQWAAMDALLAAGELLLQMAEAYQQQNELAYKKALDTLQQLPGIETVLAARECTTPQYLHCALGLQTETGHRNVLQALSQGGEQMHRGKASQADSFANQVQQYVQTHYMEEIGIDTVARIFELTPSYVSRLFRQKTGRKFIDYLTEVRMVNAKRILAEHSVQQTAVAVGYLSTRHFTKLFSRYTGMLPSEYQRGLRPQAGDLGSVEG